MKKVFGIAALLLALAACNKVETEIKPVEQPSDSKGITITATLAPKTAVTKAVADKGDNKITVTWAENEHIAILYDKDGAQVADAEIISVDDEGTATIQFTVVDGTPDNTSCALVYPYSAAKDDKSGVKDAATLLSAQDGTLNANLDVRVGAGTIRTTTPGLDVTTQPEAQFAIFKFTLSGPSIDATHPLVIKDNASNKTITTVTPASTATSVFVAMPAAASTTYKFVVITADNKYIKSGTATIEAGKYYQTPLTLEPRYPLALSSATADDLGAVVNSEGQMSVEKAAASGTAVGIVGKVTETGHGLILALQDATSQNWNTINGWESVTTYASTTLKVLPDDAARGTKLTSFTTLGSTTVSNWAVAQKSDYEAIFQTLGSTAGDGDGTTYDGNVNAYITTGVGGAAISGDYWSATEYDDDLAWDFFSDFWDYSDKTNSYSVRPVLGFGGDAAPATDLSTLNDDHVAQDGETLTGTLGRNVKISIADGATVTLKDVTITNLGDNCNWAGINCLGNATLVLEGTNEVCAGRDGVGDSNYPGIYIAPDNTLTIQGTGTLTAYSNGTNPYGAGIGGGFEINCGNIVINSGTITATGGDYAAGIGSGSGASCGSITINGGTVTATGGVNAAGIGSGYDAFCGNITISGGVTSVTATKGSSALYSIGAGIDGTCDTVTIGGTVYANGITVSPYTYPTTAYTMAASATASDKDKLICTDGHIHAYGADAACTKNRVAKIIYVGTTGDATYSHGLALALADEVLMMNWETAKTACSNKNTSTPVTDATWLLASKEQWDYMIGEDGADGYENLRDGFNSVGGTNLEKFYYWSSTEDNDDSDLARIFRFDNDEWTFENKGTDDGVLTRACLAF